MSNKKVIMVFETLQVRKILTESQLGESVTGGGLSDELLQSTFSVGLKGSNTF